MSANSAAERSTVLDPTVLDQNNFCGTGLKVHPVANLFPMIEGKEFEDLCLDIESRGLQNPIVVLDGVLLDGRNRLRACATRHVEPKFIAYGWHKEREDEWIISQNLHRRSITQDQRAALVAKYYDFSKQLELARLAKMANLIPGPHGSPKGANASPSENAATAVPHQQRSEFAKKAGVGEIKARQVIFVAKNQPGLLDDVLAGKTKLIDAERIAREAVGRVQAERSDWDLAREVHRFARRAESAINAAPESQRAEFCQAVQRVMEGLCK